MILVWTPVACVLMSLLAQVPTPLLQFAVQQTFPVTGSSSVIHVSWPPQIIHSRELSVSKYACASITQGFSLLRGFWLSVGTLTATHGDGNAEGYDRFEDPSERVGMRGVFTYLQIGTAPWRPPSACSEIL